MAEKVCKQCKVMKSLNSFAESRQRRDGRIARCKSCYNERRRTALVNASNPNYVPPPPAELPSTKICHKCGRIKAVKHFYSNKGCAGGRGGICYTCKGNSYKKSKASKPVPIRIAPAEKSCKRCKNVKPIEAFIKDSKCSDGHHGTCRDCSHANRLKYYENRSHESPPETIFCNRCGETQPHKAFRRFHKTCKRCQKEQSDTRTITPPTDTKTCTACSIELNISEFSAVRHSSDGLNQICKKCHQLRSILRKEQLDKIRLDIKMAAPKCAECGEGETLLLEFAHYQLGTKYRTSSGRRIEWTCLSSERLIRAELTKGRFLCKVCHMRETVSQRGETNLAASRGRLKSYRDKLKLEIGTCTDCDLQVTNETTQLFHFDHLDEKEAKVAGVSQLRTIQAIDDEVSKCELVCSSCHRIRTSVRNVDNDTAGLASTMITQKFGHLAKIKRKHNPTSSPTDNKQTAEDYPPIKRQRTDAVDTSTSS